MIIRNKPLVLSIKGNVFYYCSPINVFHLLHVEFRFLSLDVSLIQLIICTRQFLKRSWRVTFIPNRSLERYSAARYGEGNFLSSFIFLLASCFSFVLAVARYAFELTKNYLLNNQIKSVQDLITDLGLFHTSLVGGHRYVMPPLPSAAPVDRCCLVECGWGANPHHGGGGQDLREFAGAKQRGNAVASPQKSERR